MWIYKFLKRNIMDKQVFKQKYLRLFQILFEVMKEKYYITGCTLCLSLYNNTEVIFIILEIIF